MAGIATFWPLHLPDLALHSLLFLIICLPTIEALIQHYQSSLRQVLSTVPILFFIASSFFVGNFLFGKGNHNLF